jgi:hypothetical protein
MNSALANSPCGSVASRGEEPGKVRAYEERAGQGRCTMTRELADLRDAHAAHRCDEAGHGAAPRTLRELSDHRRPSVRGPLVPAPMTGALLQDDRRPAASSRTAWASLAHN